MTDCNAGVPLLYAIICMGLCRMAGRGLDLREKMKVDTMRDCESGNEKHIWTQPRKTRIYNKICAVSWHEAKQWNGLFKQRHGCITVCLWSCKPAAAVVLMAVAHWSRQRIAEWQPVWRCVTLDDVMFYYSSVRLSPASVFSPPFSWLVEWNGWLTEYCGLVNVLHDVSHGTSAGGWWLTSMHCSVFITHMLVITG